MTSVMPKIRHLSLLTKLALAYTTCALGRPSDTNPEDYTMSSNGHSGAMVKVNGENIVEYTMYGKSYAHHIGDVLGHIDYAMSNGAYDTEYRKHNGFCFIEGGDILVVLPQITEWKNNGNGCKWAKLVYHFDRFSIMINAIKFSDGVYAAQPTQIILH